MHIGTGETDAVRFIASAAKMLHEEYEGIHFHISSGNSEFVTEQLEKGLIDFGVVFGSVDNSRFNSLELPYKDSWGVLMKKDSPLAEKTGITPDDLWDKPLIISRQEDNGALTKWMGKEISELNIVGTYNLIFNASLMVEEGLGYAIGLDKIINTSGESRLCFRPLSPERKDGMSIIWKKYRVLTKPAEKFIQKIRAEL